MICGTGRWANASSSMAISMPGHGKRIWWTPMRPWDWLESLSERMACWDTLVDLKLARCRAGASSTKKSSLVSLVNLELQAKIWWKLVPGQIWEKRKALKFKGGGDGNSSVRFGYSRAISYRGRSTEEVSYRSCGPIDLLIILVTSKWSTKAGTTPKLNMEPQSPTFTSSILKMVTSCNSAFWRPSL